MWKRHRWAGWNHWVIKPSFRIRRPNGWLIFFMVLFAVIFLFIWLMEQQLQPILMTIAKTEIKKMAQDAMLAGVQEVEEKMQDDLNQVMAIEQDQQGKISYIRFHPRIQAQIYNKVTESISKNLKKLEEKKVRITIGQIFESKVFAEWGPDISIQMWPKGASQVNFVPKLESQGINMVMVTLYIHVHTEMGMVVPFTEKTFPVDFQYPIAQTLVVGDVPQYYFYQDQGQMKKGQVQMPVAPVPALPQFEDQQNEK